MGKALGPSVQQTKPQRPQSWPLRPCLSASRIMAYLSPRRAPSSHTSLLPSALAREHSHPPEGLRTNHPLFPQFSLDPGKTGCFVSPEAQLKHHHSREVLPDYFSLLARDPPCSPQDSRLDQLRTSLLQVPPLGLPGGPAAGTLCSRCGGPGIDPGQGARAHMPTLRLSRTK